MIPNELLDIQQRWKNFKSARVDTSNMPPEEADCVEHAEKDVRHMLEMLDDLQTYLIYLQRAAEPIEIDGRDITDDFSAGGTTTQLRNLSKKVKEAAKTPEGYDSRVLSMSVLISKLADNCDLLAVHNRQLKAEVRRWRDNGQRQSGKENDASA